MTKPTTLINSLLSTPSLSKQSLEDQVIGAVRALAQALSPEPSPSFSSLALLSPTPKKLQATLDKLCAQSLQLSSFSSSFDRAFFLVESYGHILAASNPTDQHKRGAFLTPFKLAQSLVPKVFAQKPWTLGRRLCDPSMGGGVFLLSALHFLESRTFKRKDIIPCLYGVDQSPVAVEVTRLAFALLGAPQAELLSNFILGNALAPPEDPRCPGNLRQPFEYVIGNPPWLSFSGRHKEGLSKQSQELLDRYYSRAAEEKGRVWPSLHGPFLQRMAHLTAKDGCLGVLFPAQMTDLEGYQGVRQKVQETLGAPIEIADLGEDAFPGVVCPSVFGVFHEGAQAKADDSKVWRYGGENLGASLDQALSRHPPFPQECFGDIGVHTGNVSKQVIFKDLSHIPIREGKQISPFALSPAKKSVLIGATLPKGSYWRHRVLEVYRGVPILIRQTAKRPIAARHREPSYFRNSALACFGLPDWSIEVLLAILNSETLGLLHSYRYRDARQQSFPQVKVAHLRAYPLPDKARLKESWRDKQSLEEHICARVRSLENGALRPENILVEIEEAVGQLYGLSDALVAELVAKLRQRIRG
ncbi:MAG: N-6 DNA methylase [Planctomycetota bacterium]|nr:N-6 DNA methylase [Planctomycetota bacterium]